MNKELEQIRKRSAELLKGYPEAKADLTKKLAEAEENQQKAKAALEAAEDMETYDKCTEDLKRAELGTKFARNALNKLDAAPRMSEKEYLEDLNVCKGLMNKTVSSYRAKAVSLMDQLKALQEEYLATVQDINSCLITLDTAANVLQCKYPCRIQHYTTDEPDTFREEKIQDPTAWKSAALRYEPATACTLATKSIDPTYPYQTHDSVLTAAWRAVNTGYPHINF